MRMAMYLLGLALVGVSADAAVEADPTPSPAPAELPSVLVLTGGQKLVVRQWLEDGRLLRVVDEQGNLRLLKTEQLDRERTELATRQHRSALAQAVADREAQAERARTAAEAKVRRDEKIAAQRAARSTRGTMNTAPELPADLEPPPLATPSEGRARADELPAQMKKELGDALARRRRIAADYNALARKLNEDPMADYDGGRVQLDAWRKEMAAIDERIDAIRSRYPAR